MKLIITAMLSFICLTGCTYSITQVHTQGQASDVVDETATNTPSTSLTIPVSATGMPSLPIPSTTVIK